MERRITVSERHAHYAGKAIQGRDGFQLEARPAIGIHRPLEQVGLATLPEGPLILGWLTDCAVLRDQAPARRARRASR
ncbi:hypothetical protein ACFQXB_10065 [Plastorhodobacter daqingensis]|uniref:Uncharacterized protein n=1 Tax=Plastorhodobacter daqingensis TaxID=1387281 RepID=A0ABW2UKF3_9RHOB